MKSTRLYILHFTLSTLVLSGCFNEPEPAYKTVPAQARVYLQDKGFTDFKSASQGLDAKIVDYINLDRNALANIDGVEEFTQLKWLRLNDNKLSTLPDLKDLTSLSRIYLRGNSFKEVPETLKSLPSLTDIDISGNPVTAIPEWLAKKEGLKFLSFNHTLITKLPEDISAWKGLKALQLGGLKLSSDEMARIRKALPDVAIVF